MDQLSEFRYLAEMWGDYINLGKNKPANKVCNQLTDLVTHLKETPDWEQHFIDLLDHPSEGAAYWAAVNLTDESLNQSLSALRRLSEKPSLVGFSASMSLKKRQEKTEGW